MKKIFLLALLIAGTVFASNPKTVNPKLINLNVKLNTIELAKFTTLSESTSSTVESVSDELAGQDCASNFIPLYYLYHKVYGFDHQSSLALAEIAVMDCISHSY